MGMEIEYSTGTYYTEAGDYHRFFATENGTRIGELYIDITTHIIMNIEVIPEHRGEGIARRLYEAAVTSLPAVYHAPEAGCTPEGAAFAQAVGGPVAEAMEELGDMPDWYEEEYAA